MHKSHTKGTHQANTHMKGHNSNASKHASNAQGPPCWPCPGVLYCTALR